MLPGWHFRRWSVDGYVRLDERRREGLERVTEQMLLGEWEATAVSEHPREILDHWEVVSGLAFLAEGALLGRPLSMRGGFPVYQRTRLQKDAR